MRETTAEPGNGALEYVKAAGAFILVCAVLVGLLMLLNAGTERPIRQGESARRRAQLEAVMPGAESFSETWFDHSRADEVLAAFTGTQLDGYCVTVTAHGFGGEMELLVGVDVNGSVTGVMIVDHNETGEVGAAAREPEFLDQFLGKSGTIRVNDENNGVDAVSGATITSQAVTDGVNAALAAVADLQGGGDAGEEGTV